MMSYENMQNHFSTVDFECPPKMKNEYKTQNQKSLSKLIRRFYRISHQHNFIKNLPYVQKYPLETSSQGFTFSIPFWQSNNFLWGNYHRTVFPFMINELKTLCAHVNSPFKLHIAHICDRIILWKCEYISRTKRSFLAISTYFYNQYVNLLLPQI